MNELEANNTSGLHLGSDNDLLDRLFAQARAEQTEIVDDNFTKTLLNSLPSKRPAVGLFRARLHATTRQYIPDVIGLVVSLFAVFMLVDPAALASTVLSLLPDFSISFATITTAAVVVCVAATAAWWSVERSPAFD